MLQIAPEARLIDVSHLVSPQDVMEAAFVLRQCMSYLPERTVHLAVVDPGVGTERLAVAARQGETLFVAPDNGILTLVLDGTEPDEVVVLDRPEFWRVAEPGSTFHGRDIFGPVAAHLAAGVPLSEVGSPLERLLPMSWPLPMADESGIRGWIAHVDRYGNCLTNIPRLLVNQHGDGRRIRCYAGANILNGIAETYADVDLGEAVVLFGSSEHLEISINGGTAAELLSLSRGQSVDVVFLDER